MQLEQAIRLHEQELAQTKRELTDTNDTKVKTSKDVNALKQKKRHDILDRTEIFCSTLSSSALEAFRGLFENRGGHDSVGFRDVH
jgi:hypothetical protein